MGLFKEWRKSINIEKRLGNLLKEVERNVAGNNLTEARKKLSDLYSVLGEAKIFNNRCVFNLTRIPLRRYYNSRINELKEDINNPSFNTADPF